MVKYATYMSKDFESTHHITPASTSTHLPSMGPETLRGQAICIHEKKNSMHVIRSLQKTAWKTRLQGGQLATSVR